MTISWGSYENSGGLGMRAGIQIESVTVPNNGSSTFVVTFSCWTQNTANYADNQDFDLTDSGGVDVTFSDDSIAYTNNQTTAQTKRGSNQTATYTYSTYGSSPGSIKINGAVSGAFNGVTPNITVSYPVPLRPYSAPSAPTSVTSTRISDTQVNLSWTNNSTSSGAYTSIGVYRSTDGGAYALVATLGVVTSYSDTTVSTNHKYQYKIRAINSTAGTDSSATTAVYMTPGTPTGLVATKLASGNIRLDWTGAVNYGDTAYTTRIEASQNGGAYSELTSVSGGVITYEHTSPSTAVTWTYRVRHRSTTGSLNGSYSTASNTVVLIATANAPTGLSPSGVARDAAAAIALTWTHNPADGTPQSKRRVQAKVNAGSYADLVNDTSATSSYTVSAATWTNGDTITWKVATAGENGTLGAYSAESTITLSAVPTVTISAPSATYSTSTLTATWVYFQAQSSAQATWTANLYDAVGTLIETQSGTTETEVTFAATLEDGATYSVEVTVTSAAGLTSVADTESFVVTYLPPAAVTIEATYDDDSGCMVLTITGADAEVGVTEEITTVDIQRQIDGGAWVTLATGLVLDGDPLTAIIIDTAPTINGSNVYRAVAYSALPSSAMSDEESAPTTEGYWSFLSAGEGFATIVRAKAMPTFQATASLDRALYHFADRPNPVQLDGTAESLSLAYTAELRGDSSTAQEWEAMGRTAGIMLWREPTGRRVYVSLGSVQIKRDRAFKSGVSFSMSEVDYTE